VGTGRHEASVCGGEAAHAVQRDHVGVEDDSGHGRSVTVSGTLRLAHLLDVEAELLHLLIGVEQVAERLQRLRAVLEARPCEQLVQLALGLLALAAVQLLDLPVQLG
jgi:hypothetical protein